MYGYFRPFRMTLEKEEKIVFISYYCRICYNLWLAGNQHSRYLVTFDLALYSLVLNLAGIGERPDQYPCQRVSHKVRDKFKNDEVGKKLANLTLAGFGGKIEDDYHDKQYLRATFLKLLFGSQIKKSIQVDPVFMQNTRDVCALINEIQDRNGSAEDCLDAYGKSAVKSFTEFGNLEEKYQKVIYQLARWAFFMDMFCDYNKDVKEGNNNSYYNPEYKTIQEYLDADWVNIVPLIRKENEDLFNSVMAIKQRKDEWYILRDVVVDAINNIGPGLLRGEDVSFHYFKELFYNMRSYNHLKKVQKLRRSLEEDANN